MARLFSDKLISWLNKPGNKTYGDLQEEFGDKSYAVLLILLMITAALPLPTGGITHVFELAAMLIAIRIIIFPTKFWLPKKLSKKQVGHRFKTQALPRIIKFLSTIERYSRPRFSRTINNQWFVRLIGFVILIFTLGAFLAPPFTGLDTLPAMGVLLAALAMLFDDIALLLFSILLGVSGLVLEISIGGLAWHFLH